jgi:inorganic phosphate transporter, PiT family
VAGHSDASDLEATEFAGPFLFGVVVARGTINPGILIAALSSAIVWDLFTWFLGLPSSSSHAMVGGDGRTVE